MPHDMHIPLNVARITALALALIAGPPAQAAKIETTMTPEMEEMGCTVRLSGTIVPDDLAALSAALADPPLFEDLGDRLPFSPAFLYGFPFGTHRLCLDSPGGDLSTALDIAASLDSVVDEYGRRGVPTAVAAGDRCEGACGLIFMAGRYSWQSFNETYWRQDRVLNPQGHLSLPASALTNAADPQAVLARLTRLIAERAIGLTPGLLADMLATDAAATLPIETVEAASRYRIEVAPIAMRPVLNTPVETLRANACANAAAMLQGRFTLAAPQTSQWMTRAVAYENPDRVLDFVGSLGGYIGTGSALSEPTGYSCAAVSAFLTDGTHEYLGTDPATHEAAYNEMRGDGYGSIGFVNGPNPEEALSPYDPELDVDIGPVEIGPLQLHTPAMLLSDL